MTDALPPPSLTRMMVLSELLKQVLTLFRSTEGLTVDEAWRILNNIQSSLLVQGLLSQTLTPANLERFVAWQCERIANTALDAYQETQQAVPSSETRH